MHIPCGGALERAAETFDLQKLLTRDSENDCMDLGESAISLACDFAQLVLLLMYNGGLVLHCTNYTAITMEQNIKFLYC